ncbi:MAG: GH92 family glycosyl hydrolase [Cyclobacteriaceae bacterium]
MKNIFWIFLVTSPIIISAQTFDKITDPEEYANPLMGTDSKPDLSNGNTYPAIALPWGLNFWTPQTGKSGDGFIYEYDADRIRGFKQTHQASNWIGDYGQFAIMPVTGSIKFNEDKRASWFSHKTEISKPYYYSVYLAEHNVVTEIAPTERAAVFRITYQGADSAYIVIDALDKGSYVKIIPEENKIIGYSTKNSKSVPENFRNYFVLYFSEPFSSLATFNGNDFNQHDKEEQADHCGAVVGFKPLAGQVVELRVASSFMSHEQAEINLKEIGNDDFQKVKQKAKDAWKNELSRIKIEGGTVDQARVFYTCLYRSLLFPRKFYELDKNKKVMHYSPYNGKVVPGYMFTDNGFFDTFRALFPFFNLMYPQHNAHIMEGLVNAYNESGWLPEWASPGHHANVTFGAYSASIIADAYLKGIRGYDINKLYEAILKNTQNEPPKEIRSVGRLGVHYYNELGYVPYDVNVKENTSRTLEYAYLDFAISRLAKALDRPQQEVELFEGRSLNYKKHFDPGTGLMRGKNRNGEFQSPFNPFKWGGAFTEGNSWHYTWSVVNDVQGLIDLMGGKEKFVKKLDSVFMLPPIYDESYYKIVIHEIREMQIVNMGQYVHGNQPMQHVVYLYNFAGAPWKTQFWIKEMTERLYTPTPDGYCGDEDTGQTSAWYVFSALGFYPVTPGTDQYVLGTPMFRRVTIELANGKQIIINADNNSNENRYISKLEVNGISYTKNWLSHRELMKGATLNFVMSSVPDKKRGIQKEDLPYSYSLDNDNHQK